MQKINDEISPEEIRDIRKDLGLSQADAGELLGGGPRAFTKYEAGSVKPAASLVRLLRLLGTHPEMIASLKGNQSRPMTGMNEPRPFEVSSEHIAALTDKLVHLLLERLLVAEAVDYGLPVDGIHVADNITVPDGGEDGRIEWRQGPDHTPFLPSRLTQFQLKAGKITPSKAGNEVRSKRGEVKEMARKALEAGGHYVMLCAHPYVKQDIEKREVRIRSALRDAGLHVEDKQVQFRGANEIAVWVNRHPAVASWVIELTQPGTIGPFHSWNHWARSGEYERSPWVPDERLQEMRSFLLERVGEPKGIVRVVGLSAIGKSRLVLEALGSGDDDGRGLSSIVLYADRSEADWAAVNHVVQTWADMRARAVVVVDRCAPTEHETLANLTACTGSRLSLVTIDNEVDTGVPNETTFVVDVASRAVTEGVLARQARGLDEDTRQRLARFADGYPGLAVRVGEAWTRKHPVVHATKDHFVKAFILGRDPKEAPLVEKTARLLSVFGLIWHDDASFEQLNGIAGIETSLTESELRSGTKELILCGVAQRRGRFVRIQPRPVAAKLAERQWHDWSRTDWDMVLSGLEPRELRILAARQLVWLGETDISRDVVVHVCRRGGPFGNLEGGESASHAEVLSNLAEIDPDSVVKQIERSLGNTEDLAAIDGRTRRHLVSALERVCFDRETFEEGAELLLRLAVAENEPNLANNATGQFCALFPMFLGATEADGRVRLAFLREAVGTDETEKLAVLVQALIKATETDHFIRFGSSQRRGLQPDRVSWSPNTNQDATDYIKECLDLLADVASRKDNIGEIARDGLGHRLRSLVRHGFIGAVERVVECVTVNGTPWKAGLESLSQFVRHNSAKAPPDTVKRVKRLIENLAPAELADRARYLITDMPWHFPTEEKLDMEARESRQEEAIRELAGELLRQPDELRGMLPSLRSGFHRMATLFGMHLAELTPDPVEWLEMIYQATVEAPKGIRNFDLLAGYLSGMAKRCPDVLKEYKRIIADSSEMAPAFPFICWQMGILRGDIELAIESLQAGRLPPEQLDYWKFGGQLAKFPVEVVSPLFDTMLDHSSKGFVVGLELMGMYVFGDLDRLEKLRPQICMTADNVLRWEGANGGPTEGSHFEEIMQWMLAKGRTDPDARKVALALSKALVQVSDVTSERLFASLVPALLADFPEISWPLVGNAVISDELRSWRLQFVLSDRGFGVDDRGRPILHLPEETLFAWCAANPEVAPEFVAGVVPILGIPDEQDGLRSLHPVMARLLDEFGDIPGVVEGVESNLNSFGWVGSVVPYYESYIEPLEKLKTHSKMRVRRWASNALGRVLRQIENAHNEDEERTAIIES